MKTKLTREQVVANLKANQEKHNKWQAERLEKILHSLLEITHDCRDDMHEPDEQGLEALVVGGSFDNAMCDNSEMTVVLRKESADSVTDEIQINLCDLIALARKANPAMKVSLCQRCFKQSYPLLHVKLQDGSIEKLCPACQREIPSGESAILGIE